MFIEDSFAAEVTLVWNAIDLYFVGVLAFSGVRSLFKVSYNAISRVREETDDVMPSSYSWSPVDSG